MKVGGLKNHVPSSECPNTWWGDQQVALGGTRPSSSTMTGASVPSAIRHSNRPRCIQLGWTFCTHPCRLATTRSGGLFLSTTAALTAGLLWSFLLLTSEVLVSIHPECGVRTGLDYNKQGRDNQRARSFHRQRFALRCAREQKVVSSPRALRACILTMYHANAV